MPKTTSTLCSSYWEIFRSFLQFNMKLIYFPTILALQAILQSFFCFLALSTFHYSLHRNAVKDLFDKLKDVQFKYRFVVGLCNVFKFSFNGSVCATKGKLLDLLEEAVKSANIWKEFNEYHFFQQKMLRIRLKEQLHSISKKAKLETAGAADLLESIAITRKSKHQRFFFQSIDSFLGDFFKLWRLFCTIWNRKNNSAFLKAKITQLNHNS